MHGHGSGRLLLLGHLDTVVSHDGHTPVTHIDGGEKLRGSGSVDMKGGVVLALEVLRALAQRPDGYQEVALLLVNDEEWRTAPFAHAARFAGWEGCLCFEAGERSGGDEAVVVRRKAAGAIEVTAEGRAAHAGSAPDLGRNALLALAQIAQRLSALHDPAGPDRRTVVPSVIRAGEALNVVPPTGELLVDVRADRLEAFAPVLEAVPPELDGVRLAAEQIRAWPGMDTEDVHGARARGRLRAGGAPDRRGRARRRERRQPLRLRGAAHRRRARPARRRGASPGRVRAARLRPPARRGRPRARGGAARALGQ